MFWLVLFTLPVFVSLMLSQLVLHSRLDQIVLCPLHRLLIRHGLHVKIARLDSGLHFLLKPCQQISFHLLQLFQLFLHKFFMLLFVLLVHIHFVLQHLPLVNDFVLLFQLFLHLVPDFLLVLLLNPHQLLKLQFLLLVFLLPLYVTLIVITLLTTFMPDVWATRFVVLSPLVSTGFPIVA